MNRRLREVIGYAVGAILVWALLPYGIYALSRLVDGLLALPAMLDSPTRSIIALPLAVLGIVFGLWSVIEQRTMGHGGPVQLGNVEISPKTRDLVVSGPYKYTRNPMLFGAVMIYLGFAIYLGSISAVLVVLAFAAFMLAVVVKSEERRLARDFGEAYEEYRENTSMFIPWRGRSGKKT